MPSHTSEKAVIDLTAENDTSHPNVIDLADSDEDDEDLRAAIALSLQQHGAEQSNQDSPIELDAPAFSGDSSLQAFTAEKKDTQDVKKKQLSPKSSNTLLSIDRKQMEMDRLARLKRKREGTQPGTHAFQETAQQFTPNQSSLSHNKSDKVPQSPQKPQKHKDLVYVSRSTTETLPNTQQAITKERGFPTGRIMLTSTGMKSYQLEPHTQSFISMIELLQPTDAGKPLRSALFCAFNVDFDWLLPMLDTTYISFCFVLHGANDSHRAALKQDFDGIKNVRLVFPYIGGFVNCMHSKLMLLFYEEEQELGSISKPQGGGRCRLVIPTANLIGPDWGSAGVMENAVFVIDLPEKPIDLETSSERRTKAHASSTLHFEYQFKSMLLTMGIPQEVLTKLDRYDFAATSKFRLVHTCGGPHQLTSDVALRPTTSTGLIGLSDTIASMGLAVDTSQRDAIPKVDYITSSLGKLTHKFVANLLAAVCGKARLLCETTTNPRNNKLAAAGSDAQAIFNPTQVSKSLNIYFPSEQTVKASRGGTASAGMLLFNPKNLDATTKTQFLRECLRDCIGVRGDSILMHSKIMYVRFTQPRMLGRVETGPTTAKPGTEKKRLDAEAASLYTGWVYVGSANLSESAWGSIVQDAKTKKGKLNCRNWEAGIIVPVPISVNVQSELNRGKSLHDLSLQEVFGHIVPVPIKEPAESYMDGRKPWIAAN